MSFDKEECLRFLEQCGLYDPQQKKATGLMLFYSYEGGRSANTESLAPILKRMKQGPVNVYMVPAKVDQFNYETRTTKSGEDYQVLMRRESDLATAGFLALVAEHDDVSKEESCRIVAESGLPEPTFQIDTGGKSIHHWWLLDEAIGQDVFVQAQSRLAQLLGADTKVNLPTQVFRLPGFPHRETGEVCRVIKTNEDLLLGGPIRYGYEALDRLLPELQNDKHEGPKQAHPLSSGTTPTPARSSGKVAWFDLLETPQQGKCINQMIAKIVDVYGRDDRGGSPPHEIRMRFLPGIFRHYSSRTSGEMYDLVTKHFSWDSKRYPGKKGFEAWYKGLRVDGYLTGAISIGSTIRVAKECGFDTAPWREAAGAEPGSIAAIIAEELFDFTSGQDRHLVTLKSQQTYLRRPGQFHYEHIPDSELHNQVSVWLFENIKKKFAAVDAVVKALKQLTCQPCRVAPDGYILCTNGVLEIVPGKIKLYEYTDPKVQDMVFLNAPGTTYDPNADRTHARRVLEGLENEEAREVYLRVAAQALNTRALKSTPVALLNLGEGSNGKDVCADLLKHIFGTDTVCDIDISDLVKVNDSSQNNGTLALLPLMEARFNLPAETSTKTKLDHVPALKKVITMESLKARGHGMSFETFHPRAIHMFSINEAVLADSNSAMDRRFRAVRWPYQYKFPFEIDETNPFHRPAVAWYRPLAQDLEGQERVRQQITPGFLLELIEAFDRLTGATPTDFGPGIPTGYSKHVRADMRASTDHVKEFLMDLEFPHTDSKLSEYSVSQEDMWYLYRLWCLETGQRARVVATQDPAFEGKIEILREDKDSCHTPTALKNRIHKAENLEVVKASSNNCYGLKPTRYWSYLSLPEALRNPAGGLIDRRFE